NAQDKITTSSSQILFFVLAINKISDKDIAAKLKTPALSKYAPWLRDIRSYKPYQLSDDLEKLLHEKYGTGRAAWSRLFDETMAGLRFPYDKKILTSAEAFDLLSAKDAATRKKAAI